MDREARNEASRRWAQAAAQTPEAQELVAFGWQVVSPYGYAHPTGWTIERCRTNGAWETLLWDSKHIRGRCGSSLEAAKLHAKLIPPR